MDQSWNFSFWSFVPLATWEIILPRHLITSLYPLWSRVPVELHCRNWESHLMDMQLHWTSQGQEYGNFFFHCHTPSSLDNRSVHSLIFSIQRTENCFIAYLLRHWVTKIPLLHSVATTEMPTLINQRWQQPKQRTISSYKVICSHS